MVGSLAVIRVEKGRADSYIPCVKILIWEKLTHEQQAWIGTMSSDEIRETEYIIAFVGEAEFLRYWDFYRDTLGYARTLQM